MFLYSYYIDIIPYFLPQNNEIFLYVSPSISLFKPFILLSHSLYITISVLYYYIVVIITILLIFSSLSRWQLLANQFSLNYLTILTENEKELNAIDDLIYIYISFILIFIYNFSVYSFFFFFQINILFLYFFFFNLFFILICIPLNILLDYGFYFSIYIRGCSSSLLIYYEIILDYINILAYWLRIIIQLIRLVVILVTFYTFNEMYIEYYYYYIFLFNSLSLSHQISYNFILNISYFLIHWFFEFWHLLFIFLLQSIAFNIMILWLFQFLFTLFFYETLEIFFIKYRK
jgi:hypothetical protein